MKHLFIVASALLLLPSCGQTEQFTTEHTKGPSRGEGFEQLVLRETDAGLDTLVYISLPFTAGHATIRLHSDVKIGVSAVTNGIGRNGWSDATIRYSELKHEQASRLISAPVVKGGYLVANHTLSEHGRSESFALMLDGEDYWMEMTAPKKDDIAFLRELIGEQMSAAYDGQFLVRDIYSTKKKSVVVTYRLAAE